MRLTMEKDGEWVVEANGLIMPQFPEYTFSYKAEKNTANTYGQMNSIPN